MVDVIFYEKPGCINNAKQKKLLQEAGHRVKTKNLLTEPWTEAKLLAFFNHLPVKSWINQSAPMVKSGEIDPDMLTAEQAMRCLLEKPILIRRPLMQVGTTKIVGFEPQHIKALLNVPVSADVDLESCPKDLSQSSGNVQLSVEK
jgi:nitrogenase-associated protein